MQQKLKIAFVLFHYRPFGGLPQDFLHIAQVCARRGHDVHVYTMEWRGEIPEGFTVNVLEVRGMRNHTRSRAFGEAVAQETRGKAFDIVFGFNRLRGLDLYFAADPCYEAKVRRLYGAWYRLTSRYREYSAAAHSIFDAGASTHILLLTDAHIPDYARYYGTPPDRFTVLPPGISPDRRAPENRAGARKAFRDEYCLAEDDRLMLLVGSGFRTKGLDRAIRALSNLPLSLRNRTQLMVLGEDKEKPFRRLARRLGVEDRVRFMQGRDDVLRFMLGADVLVHPAYSENTGIVIIEAVIAGLPVLVTGNCGYAVHVQKANAGTVLPQPFDQGALEENLAGMLESPDWQDWSDNGVRYGRENDLYSMPEVAADCIESHARKLRAEH